MKKNRRLRGLFVMHEGINSSIFHSQVVEHVIGVKSDFNFEILTFNTEPELWNTSKSNLEELKVAYPRLKIHLVKSINIFYPFAFLWHCYQLIVFIRTSKVDYDFIHARSDYSHYIVGLSKIYHKLNSVWDCRGDAISEIKFALQKKNLIYRLYGAIYILPFFKFLIKKNITKSDHIFCVSEYLKEVVVRNNLPNSEIDIIPCLVNENLFFFNDLLRVRMREYYNIKPSQKVFMYSGSMVSYQSFSDQVEFYRKVLSDDTNVLFILTSQIDRAKSFFERFKAKNIVIKTVSFSEINGYYNMSDYAILLRNDNQLNKVASPTKFGEYCLAGLDVIMNVNVKQCHKNAGIIGNLLSEDCVNFPPYDIKRRVEIALRSKHIYSRHNYVHIYRKVYLKIVDRND